MLADRRAPAEALPLYDAALAGFRAALGPVHLRVAQALAGRAACLAALGRPDAALADFGAAADLWAEVSPDHPGRADALVGQSRLLIARGDAAGAAPLLREAVRIRTRAFGPRHPATRAAAALRG